jgi:TonB family protein
MLVIALLGVLAACGVGKDVSRPTPRYHDVPSAEGKTFTKAGLYGRGPRLLRTVEPCYPRAALEGRFQGVVILEAEVGPTGSVVGARVLRGLPPLDVAAVDAVMQWQYSPMVDAKTRRPVACKLEVSVSFALGRGLERCG